MEHLWEGWEISLIRCRRRMSLYLWKFWKKPVLKVAAFFTGYDEVRPLERVGEVEEDSRFARSEDWDPEYLESEEGYNRNWGDAAVMSPYFEILRKETDNGCSFKIICPSFLRRPVEIYTEDSDAWGGY